MHIGGRSEKEGEGSPLPVLTFGAFPECDSGRTRRRRYDKPLRGDTKHLTEALPKPALLYHQKAITMNTDPVSEAGQHREERYLGIEAEVSHSPLHEGEGGLAVDCLALCLDPWRGIVQGEPEGGLPG